MKIRILLSIPHGKDISDVLNMLRDEYGTASNIKSFEFRDKLRFGLSEMVKAIKEIGPIPQGGITITFTDRVNVEPLAKVYLFRKYVDND